VKVSVIIPLYNKASYIGRALASVRAQTFTDYEVLVVDDGSTDGGAEIVVRWGDPRVRVITQKNAGPAAARNRALDQAAGAYVAFLDADDEWMPPFLEQSLALLGRHGPEVATVSSGYVLHPSGRSTETMWRRRGLSDGVYRLTPETPPPFVVHLLAYLSPWNTLARTSRVRRWGGFCRRGKCLYGEDSYLWLKVLLNEPVAVNLRPLVHFHSEASALSRNLGRARPVEPILLYPSDLEEVCPAPLGALLKDVLALRAMKTAAMLAYWGQWRQAGRLLKQFCPRSTWPLVRVVAAQLGARLVDASRGRESGGS
jgi:glycosyltransferase involved in cell wall biosynthesis